MTTKITFIYDAPEDPEAFEAAYPTHLATARTIPGLERMENSKVWPKEDRGPLPAYRLTDLYFVDYDAASRAVTTAEAGAFLSAAVDLATGGVRIVFAEVEEP